KGKSEVSLILIDIDNFKKINDTYGHQIGDEVLKILGKILKDDTRKGDEPARYGGEEFAVILPDTPIDQGVLVSERIREHVEKETFHDKENRPFNVTISLGISSFIHSENKTEKALISESDQALYKAKSSGKNQTIIFKDSN
ncbi:MAG: GGDEF domain-containing protein, partial [Bdellovibrionota bacterium]|nr:GGDEF domain-containing protein [Bdellovibrionota bacterium]